MSTWVNQRGGILEGINEEANGYMRTMEVSEIEQRLVLSLRAARGSLESARTAEREILSGDSKWIPDRVGAGGDKAAAALPTGADTYTTPPPGAGLNAGAEGGKHLTPYKPAVKARRPKAPRAKGPLKKCMNPECGAEFKPQTGRQLFCPKCCNNLSPGKRNYIRKTHAKNRIKRGLKTGEDRRGSPSASGVEVPHNGQVFYWGETNIWECERCGAEMMPKHQEDHVCPLCLAAEKRGGKRRGTGNN